MTAAERLADARRRRDELLRRERECSDAIRAAVDVLAEFAGTDVGERILIRDAITELVESVTWERHDAISDEIYAAEDAMDEEITPPSSTGQHDEVPF